MAKKNNIFGKQKEEDEKKMKMQEEDEDEDNSEDEEDDEEEDQDDDEQEDGDDDDDDGFPADYTGTSFVGFAVEKGSKGYEYEFDDDLKGDALLITQACLGPDAKKGDHAVVSMSIGENTYVVAHLSYDSLPHVSLDLAIEQDVTFTVAGDCGVHLSGRRVFDNEDEGAGYDGMDAYGDMEDEDEENEIEEDDGEDDDEDDEDEEEDDEEEEEEEVNDKKRKPEKKEENGVKKQKGQDGAAKPKQQDSSKDKPKESGKVTEDAVTKAIAEIISSAPEKKADMSRIGEALAKKFNGGFKSFGLPQKSCKQFIEANKKFQIVGNDVKLAQTQFQIRIQCQWNHHHVLSPPPYLPQKTENGM